MNKTLIISAILALSVISVSAFAWAPPQWPNCGPCVNGWKICHTDFIHWHWERCTVCTPYTTCTPWTPCYEGEQTRGCSNHCGLTWSETQDCGVCTPDWSCSDWSACADGSQSRTCTDLNSCETESGKPTTTQTCTPQPEPQPTPQPQPTYQKPIGDGAWVPIENGKKDYVNPCRMNTYVSKYCMKAVCPVCSASYYDPAKCYQPKRVFTICWDNTTNEYQQGWVSNYGNYMKQKEWISQVGKWKFTWWILK